MPDTRLYVPMSSGKPFLLLGKNVKIIFKLQKTTTN